MTLVDKNAETWMSSSPNLSSHRSSVPSELYSSPPTVTGSQLTAHASPLVSVELTWMNSPQFTSVLEAVYSTTPASVQSNLCTGTWGDSLTAQAWFAAVPESAQSALRS